MIHKLYLKIWPTVDYNQYGTNRYKARKPIDNSIK